MQSFAQDLHDGLLVVDNYLSMVNAGWVCIYIYIYTPSMNKLTLSLTITLTVWFHSPMASVDKSKDKNNKNIMGKARNTRLHMWQLQPSEVIRHHPPPFVELQFAPGQTWPKSKSGHQRPTRDWTRGPSAGKKTVSIPATLGVEHWNIEHSTNMD